MSYVRIKIDKLEGVLNLLQSLPPEIVSKRGGPVLQSLKKGARILQDEEKRRLKNVLAARNTGKYSTGLLMSSVIVSRGKAINGSKGERVLVRIKKRVYPRQGNNDKVTTTLKTAHILEYGSEKQKKTPFIKPAFEAKARTVLNEVPNDLVKRLNKIVKSLSRR